MPENVHYTNYMGGNCVSGCTLVSPRGDQALLFQTITIKLMMVMSQYITLGPRPPGVPRRLTEAYLSPNMSLIQ